MVARKGIEPLFLANIPFALTFISPLFYNTQTNITQKASCEKRAISRKVSQTQN